MPAAGWNGRALLPHPTRDPVEFASDASGSWGCGAWSDAQWFQVEWPHGGVEHITFKELAAAVMALAIWGRAWRGQSVWGKCDNMAAVQVVGSRLCKDPTLMHLLRCLFFLEAHFQCHFALGCTMIWQMTCHVIGLLPSCRRSRQPTLVLNRSTQRWWTY